MLDNKKIPKLLKLLRFNENLNIHFGKVNNKKYVSNFLLKLIKCIRKILVSCLVSARLSVKATFLFLLRLGVIFLDFAL